MTRVEAFGTGVALRRLREATASLHRELESRFDAIAELADPIRRVQVIARYQRLYGQSYAALRPLLADIEGLDFEQRRRIWLPLTSSTVPTEFPSLTDRYAALGMLYVIEGSTLGGRIIQRGLLMRGISDPALAFLDPYGDAASTLWRGVVAVIERETACDGARLDALCGGGVAGFRFADRMLCGEFV